MIGKLEKFEECLAYLAGHVGTKVDSRLKAENTSGANRFGGYDRDLAAKVYWLYQADFEKLGYDANDWPHAPTQPVLPREKRRLDEIIERNLLRRRPTITESAGTR